MNLFVTGATGFVGSHFLNAACRRGHAVVALRRSGAEPRIPLSAEPVWASGSLDSFDREAMSGSDVFVHLAAHSANTPYDSLERCIYWNVAKALDCVRAAHEVGVRRFLFVGSCFEYGRTANRHAYIPADGALCPLGSYPTSKAMASLAFREFIRETHASGVIARLFQVYGDGEAPSRFWPSLRDAALSGRDFAMSRGEQVRDFINVVEVADRLVDLAEGLCSGRMRATVQVNIGTGIGRSLFDFATDWWAIWGAKGKLIPGGAPYKENELMRIVSDLRAVHG
jgi:dTDP-6-deoxy-L-talose 4-dehydrogenase (NAD+)